MKSTSFNRAVVLLWGLPLTPLAAQECASDLQSISARIADARLADHLSRPVDEAIEQLGGLKAARATVRTTLAVAQTALEKGAVEKMAAEAGNASKTRSDFTDAVEVTEALAAAIECRASSVGLAEQEAPPPPEAPVAEEPAEPVEESLAEATAEPPGG